MEREQRYESHLSEQIQLNPERNSVFAGLIQARGNIDTPRDLVEKALNGKYNRIIISGEPGLGKSSLLDQYINEIKSNSGKFGKELPLIITQYDEFLKGDDSWDDTLDFNYHMFNTILAREEENPNALHAIEVPGVGFDHPRNRGKKTFELLAENSLENSHNTLFLRMLRNNAVQFKAGLVRQHITSSAVKDEEVFDELARLNINITGINIDNFNGRMIKLLINKMANISQLKKISDEEADLMHEWSTRFDSDEEERVKGLNEFIINPDDILQTYENLQMIDRSPQLIDQATADAKRGMAFTKRQAAYYEHVFDKMGILNDSAILFNPYNPNNLTIDFSKFTRAAA